MRKLFAIAFFAFLFATMMLSYSVAAAQQFVILSLLSKAVQSVAEAFQKVTGYATMTGYVTATGACFSLGESDCKLESDCCWSSYWKKCFGTGATCCHNEACSVGSSYCYRCPNDALDNYRCDPTNPAADPEGFVHGIASYDSACEGKDYTETLCDYRCLMKTTSPKSLHVNPVHISFEPGQTEVEESIGAQVTIFEGDPDYYKLMEFIGPWDYYMSPIKTLPDTKGTIKISVYDKDGILIKGLQNTDLKVSAWFYGWPEEKGSGAPAGYIESSIRIPLPTSARTFELTYDVSGMVPFSGTTTVKVYSHVVTTTSTTTSTTTTTTLPPITFTNPSCTMSTSSAQALCTVSCVPQNYNYIYCKCDSGSTTCNISKYYCSNSSTNDDWTTYNCSAVTTTTTTTPTTTTTIPPGCSGSIVLMLAPNPIQPSGPVIPAAGGLLGCTGQLIRFRSNSCTGSTVRSCVSLGAMCIASSFTAPSSPGTYSYFATIDKNGDGDESDAGECDQEDLVVSSATTTTTTTSSSTTSSTTSSTSSTTSSSTTSTTSTTTTTTMPGAKNFKVELYGDYNLYTEYSAVFIDGESVGKACYEKVCSQCGGWDEDLATNIATSSYCSDGVLEVSFADSERVNYGCNAKHKACIYANGKWNCCEKECSSYGCSNSVSFSCADWSCVSGATTTTTSTTILGTTTTLAPSLRISCSACKLQQSCSCSLSGTCNSGLWVVKNKVPTPFSSAIVSGIPPSTVTYISTSTGELEVWASCLNPVAVEKTSVTVVS